MTRRRPAPGPVVAALVCASTLGLVSVVRAEGTALDQLDPAPPGDRAFGVQSADVRGEARLRLGLGLDLVHDSLVLSSDGGEVGAVVGDQLWGRLLASFALADRYLFSLALPVALIQSGDDPVDASTGMGAASPDSAELGDLKLGVRARLLGDRATGWQLAAGLHLWLPTGAGDSFVSDGAARAAPFVVLGGTRDRWSWSSQLGMLLRDGKDLLGDARTPVGTAVTFGAAFGFLVDDARALRLGPELYGQTVVAAGGSFFAENSTNAELLAGARYRPGGGDYEVGVAAGPGLGRGAGTPAYRVVVGVSYVPEDEEPVRDRDGDGIGDEDDACPDAAGPSTGDPTTHGCPLPADRDHDAVGDAVDACPDVAGIPSSDPARNGCPLPDRDGDGIEDAKDACPDAPGIASAVPDHHGCPDGDRDGILDADDACPAVAGIEQKEPRFNGCPPDTDRDGVVDSDDSCPTEPGVPQGDAKWNGCPLAALIAEEQQIVITQQLQFETDSAAIRSESDPILQDVLEVITAHPEITSLEVQGHTDDTGPRAHNVALSRARAQAVLRWLTEHGVAKKRLRARGYGPDRPIRDNVTPEGREKNRRVEFRILESAGTEKSK